MPTASPNRPPAQEAGDSELTNAKILTFYFPLAISWICMAVEGPVATGAISRRPNPEVNTAAFLILMGIAFWIESPIIDLLSTSTTLARNRVHYLELRRFVLYLLLVVTITHALIAFTPLFWIVTESIIGVTHDVAANARLGLMLMLPWAGAIGWRRYLQGILIRHGQTRKVAHGTFVRVASMAGSITGLYAFTHMPGVELAAIGLLCGVSSEATYIHCVSRATIRTEFTAQADDDTVVPLGTRKLASFHLPLTLTTMVTLCGMPIVSAALARAPDPILTLAAYQVGSTFLWLFRSFTYALPEVVITLYKDLASARVLKRFCLLTGAFATGAVFLLALTGLDQAYFTHVLGATPEVARVARMALLAGALLPGIGASQSYVRGMLTAHHLTVSRLVAIGLSMIVMVLVLVAGVLFRGDGVLVAGAAMTLALAAELGVLAYSWNLGKADRPSIGRSEPKSPPAA